ncbi:baseplate J/gp47 family protein [Exiguobacterium sp. CinTr1]|uniref:baseplate J/gp47 family protein n=1 Tax=Exiguobacterium sp. CinTr1 TaxID=2995315 RepID=UPI0022E872E1|nr:baseplate J/gp47 family protein [Exiguobacterium sp. CinTr1]
MSTYYDINESLFDQIMDAMLDRLPLEIDRSVGGPAYTLLAPVAAELEKLYQDLDAIEQASFLIDEDGVLGAYGTYVDRRVIEFGVQRKPGGTSTATLSVSASRDVVLPIGTQFSTSDEIPVFFATLQEYTVSNTPTNVEVASVLADFTSNVEANNITKAVGDLNAVITVHSSTAATGAFPEEDDVTLVGRFLDNQRRQSTSGNTAHYIEWATDVAGIAKARVTPIWNGPGTVKVTLIGADGGEPTPSKVAEVADYIETQRPIGADVTVVPADSLPIDITATVTLMSSADAVAVKAEFERALAEYFIDVDSGEQVTPTRVGGLLVGLADVIDYGGLTLNGGTAPITLTGDQVATIGTVTLNV